MKNLVLIFLVSVATLSIAQDGPGTGTPPPPPPVRAIAEWEPMEGVLIRYPLHRIPYYFIALLSQEIKVVTLVADQDAEDHVISQYMANWVNLDNCEFVQVSANTAWTRDYGPLYVVNGNNEVAGVDYEYRIPDHTNSNDIPVHVTDYLDIPYYLMPEVVFDGTSNYMTDGMGMAASSSYVNSLNPHLTQQEIDDYFYDYQGIETYHIVPATPGGHHIDTWAKFLAPDKILIRQVPPSHPAYHGSEAAAAYFESQMSSYGRPYQVYRVQTPNNEPYTNSLILNNRVFFPITGNSVNDDAAFAVYQEAMPGYEIYGIAGSWSPGDAIHCQTQEIPDRGMLHVFHLPVSEYQFVDEDVLIEAKITPLSGEAVYEDSVRVNYRIDDGEFVSLVMTSGSDYWYSATIPSQEIGSKISYYISAADQSGRSENHPYIGPFDPHGYKVVSPLVFQEAIIDDSEQGNDNGVFEPGETVQIIVSLKNKSQQAVIQNPLAHLATTSQHISIHPPGSAIFTGSIDPDEELTLSFPVSSSLATPDGHVAEFNLEVETDNGYDSFGSFDIEVIAHLTAELIREHFDDWLPEGWEVTSTADSTNWQHSNTNLAGGTPPETRFFWEPSTVATQRLISPNVNTSEFAQVSLEFKHYISDFAGDYSLGVESSGDGGNTWTEIMAFPDVNMPATVENIVIDNEDVGSEEFRIAWTFTGDSWNINWWNIDDVVIGGMNISDHKIGFFQGLVSLNDETGSVSHVAITSGDQVTFPDENGLYSLAVPEGIHDITASLDGYLPMTEEGIFVAEGDTITIDFNMDYITSAGHPDQDHNVSIYPNPARDKIYVVSDEKIKEIQLIDMKGQIIHQTAVNGRQAEISTGQFNAGIYILRIHTINRLVSERMMVVRH